MISLANSQETNSNPLPNIHHSLKRYRDGNSVSSRFGQIYHVRTIIVSGA